MLYYDRIDVSKGIDVNERCESKEFDICQCWYFLNKGSKFEGNICNRCHDLLIMPMNLFDILSAKSSQLLIFFCWFCFLKF